LLALWRSLAPGYDNVHGGQSSASQAMTRLFEDSYDTVAQFLGAEPSQHRAVPEYHRGKQRGHVLAADRVPRRRQRRDDDDGAQLQLVPWYAMCREILPKFGRQVDYRLARFDPLTGELDLEHMASLIDARTKLVCRTGASNFLGTRNPLMTIRALADASGYVQPDGEQRSHLLVDGAQLVPGSAVDVKALDVDYLSFSFHKLLAPFGVGALYAKEHLLESSLPVPLRR
jgi:cysteine desulfurase/selenocysteine lyase